MPTAALTLRIQRSSSSLCHPKRSEESLVNSGSDGHGKRSRCFTSLNMTARLSGLIPASFADTKLAEHGVENLFHVDCANNFADSAQCLVQVNGNVLRRQSFAHGRARAIAGFQRPAQAIAMASVDRDRAFWSEILLSYPRENFGLQFRQAFARQARNPPRRKTFPVLVLR